MCQISSLPFAFVDVPYEMPAIRKSFVLAASDHSIAITLNVFISYPRYPSRVPDVVLRISCKSLLIRQSGVHLDFVLLEQRGDSMEHSDFWYLVSWIHSVDLIMISLESASINSTKFVMPFVRTARLWVLSCCPRD